MIVLPPLLLTIELKSQQMFLSLLCSLLQQGQLAAMHCYLRGLRLGIKVSILADIFSISL